MRYRIDLYREAEKTLDSLDRTTARRIEAKIEELTRDPLIFRNLTKMDNKTYINVNNPLTPRIGCQFPTLRAIDPTSSTTWLHKSGKRVNTHHSYISRGRLSPVIQRTRTHLPNYTAFQNASIFPIVGACSQTPFLSHLRTLAYWLQRGGFA